MLISKIIIGVYKVNYCIQNMPGQTNLFLKGLYN